MKQYIILLLCSFYTVTLFAQQTGNNENRYRRSALHSILIDHPATEFNEEICDVFLKIPIPDKFDNHDLSVKIINSDKKKESDVQIESFLKNNAVGRRMAAKWFNRDPETGVCDMNLIAERGLYDATYLDVEFSKMTVRGTAMLEDAGEELIGKTFVLVNDIRYRDRQKTSKIFGEIVKVGGLAAGIATGNSDWVNLGDVMGDMVSKIKGFGVTVTSYLYRLDWNEDNAGIFYSQYYMDENSTDETKRQEFNSNKDLFNLIYVGKQQVASGKTSIEGINTDTPEQMIRKVCTRAIDESIVELQKKHEEFRVKTPLYSVDPVITAKIGLKEGVNERNTYEVLEQLVDENGKTTYKRVGVIRPVKGKIWDNRYMAVEEKAYGADFEATTFRKVSGGNFYPGMLIRELKVK